MAITLKTINASILEGNEDIEQLKHCFRREMVPATPVDRTHGPTPHSVLAKPCAVQYR